MLEQLRMVTKIYDLLALCSSYILNNLDEEPYEFATFNDTDYDGVYDAIESYCNEKLQIGSREAFNNLKDYLLCFMLPEATIEKCYAIVKYIDDLVEVEIDDMLLGGNHVIQYSTLNEQYNDQIRIIPKMKGTLIENSDYQFRKKTDDLHSLLRKRRECACSLLDKEVVNYMIWNQENKNKYPLTIYRMTEKNPIFKHFYNKKKMVFGIVPFTDEPITQILDIRYERRAFYIEQMYPEAEERLKDKYKDIINRCRSEDIDFLIFPEMLMSNSIIESLDNISQSESPQIVVNGSIWEDYSNRSVITDARGKEIATYYKKEPFEFEKDDITYREYLKRDKNKKYVMLEIDGIGRIGIGICKDLVNEEFKLFHKYIKTDILIIPAYTKSMDLQSSAEELTQDYNCVVVVSNACSALDGKSVKTDNKRIGFVTVPAKVNTDRFRIIKMYEQNECKKECTQRCIGRKISIDFSQVEQSESIISYKINETSF